ncbi:hypothetical protein L596_005245 [Steinernema carpocapsae]|uniref:Uncharacterized protein n=1 Tax=Steinernema carpocapsae TaxID=34508 RepID=A0A4V6I8E1_STECR|nr:hypothetical protein L596_005245 [Steinernema carpocapsae]
MAQQFFQQGVMQGKTMPEPVEELEPVEIFVDQEPQVSFEEDRSSATSGADADRSFDAEYGQSFESYGQAAPLLTTTAEDEKDWLQLLALKTLLKTDRATSGADADRSFDAEYGQSFESYGQAAPLLTTTAEEEEGLATAPRFEDAFVTPTVVPTDGLTDEEREHIERVMKMAQQSSFEQGVMQGKTMPEPVEELEPVEIFVDQEPQVSFEEDRSSATSGLTLIAHLTPNMDSPSNPMEGLATAPRFEDAFVTVVPTEGLTDEEREHIERVMKMAQQSSFEKSFNQASSVNQDGGQVAQELAKSVESAACVPALQKQVFANTSKILNDPYSVDSTVTHFNVPSEDATQQFGSPSLSDSSQSFNADIVINDRIALIEKLIKQTEASVGQDSPQQNVVLCDSPAETYASPRPRFSTTVSFTDNFNKRLPSNLRSSWSVSCGDEPNIDRNTPTNFGSNQVHIVYTNKTLHRSQSVHSDNETYRTCSPGDGKPRRRSENSNRMSSLDAIHYRSGRSRESSPNKEGRTPRSRRRYFEQNAFEHCEILSYNAPKASLINIDFLVKLNFFAQRLTEDIAEVAAIELMHMIKTKKNPRARYFQPDKYETETPQNLSSDSETSPVKPPEEHLFTVIRAEELEPPVIDSFFSFFRRRSQDERPKSALPFVSAGGSRKSTASSLFGWNGSHSRRSSNEKGADILDLVRRPSTADSRTSTDSPFRLPENALVGLSEEERKHVLQVLTNARKSTPSPCSSRRESVSHVIPEIGVFDNSEREHIESVLKKLENREAPFVVSNNKPRQSVEHAPPLNRPDSVVVEIVHDSYPEHEEQNSSAEEISPEKLSSDESLVEHPVQGELTQEELEHIRRIEELALQDASASYAVSPIKFSETPKTFAKPFTLSPELTQSEPSVVGELTAEELEHIRRVTEMANADAVESNRLDFRNEQPPTESAKQPAEPEFTLEELEHIRRIAEMAEQDRAMSVLPSMGPAVVENDTFIPLTSVAPVSDFTEEELEHIRRMEEQARLMELEFDTYQNSKSDEPSPSSSLPSAPLVAQETQEEALSELTSEELEHIRRIAKMAEQEGFSYTEPETFRSGQEWLPVDSHYELHVTGEQTLTEDEQVWEEDQPPATDELTEKELAHIRQIEENARLMEADTYNYYGAQPQPMYDRPISPHVELKSVDELTYERSCDVNEWYDRQLSYMRQSIADEEEELEKISEVDDYENYEDEEIVEFVKEEVDRLRTFTQQACTEDVIVASKLFAPIIETSAQVSTQETDFSTAQRRWDATNNADVRPEQHSQPSAPTTTWSMFTKSSSSCFSGFGSLSRFAKQAGEQLTAKAQQAAQVAQAASHAASTGDLSKLMAEPKGQKTSADLPPRSVSTVGVSSMIPPGLEDLSQEERDKIMAVMQCAELDAADAVLSPAPKMTTSRTAEPIFRDVVSERRLEPPPPPAKPQTAELATPTEEDINLSGLSAAEREQILAVMRMAQAEESTPLPKPTPAPVLIHEVLGDRDGHLTRRLSAEPRDIRPPVEAPQYDVPTDKEQPFEEEGEVPKDLMSRAEFEPSPEPDRQVSHASSVDTTSPQKDSGYTTIASQSYDQDIDKFEEEFRSSQAVPRTLPFSAQETEEPIYYDDQRFADENICISDGINDTIHVDAVELTDEEFMEKGTPFQASDDWSVKKPRMWTTVFTDDSDVSEERMSKSHESEDFEDEIREETRRDEFADDLSHISTCSSSSFAAVPEAIVSHPVSQANVDLGKVIGVNFEEFSPEERQHLIDMFQKANDVQFEVEMDDPLSPSFTSVQNVVFDNRKHQEAVSSATSAQQSRSPPAITITMHEDRRKTTDDDSDGETSPSSDEDDYPDQVNGNLRGDLDHKLKSQIIEAPSAPTMTLEEVERERQAQEALGKAVLQQIQSFGEAADHEFDVVHRQPSSAETTSATTSASVLRDDITTSGPVAQPVTSSAAAVSYKRRNPFLEESDEGEDGSEDMVVLCEDEEMDYSQAANYYINQQNHRAGPVYTIPETEENNDGFVNTEGKYHEKELNRRPFHASDIALTKIPTIPSVAATSVGDVLGASTSQAPKGIPATTSTTSLRDITTTVNSHDYYESHRHPYLPKQQQHVSSDASSIAPVRSAPPPPCNGTIGTESVNARFPADEKSLEFIYSLSNGKGSHFTTDIKQPPDPLPMNHSSREAAAAPDSDYNNVAASSSQVVSSATSERIAKLSSLLSERVIDEGDNEHNTSRLKRSPAMILSEDVPQSSPPTRTREQSERQMCKTKVACWV